MSMTLLEQMKSSISQQSIGYAAKLLGESSANIEKAVTIAVPALMSAITAAAHTPSGTAGQSVVSRLVGDPVNDGSLLHRLPALYQGTMTASPVYRLGTQLLQAILGAKLGKFTQTVAALSGIKPASSALLVNTLAPHIMAVVGKRHRLCGDATPQGLINLLDTEHAAVQKAIPSALADLIPPVATVATADALKASAKPAGKSSTQPAAKSAGATKAATDQPVHTTVPRREAHVKPPVVTKQSYRWGSWLPVIGLYGAGAVALAVFLTPPVEAPTGQTGVAAPTVPAQTNTAPNKTADVKPTPVKATEIKASETKTPEIKTAEIKSADAKSAAAVSAPDTKPSSASQTDAKSAVKKTDAPATPVAGKVAEAPKTAAAPAVVAPPVAANSPATLTAAGSNEVPAQANPYKPPVGVNRPLADASKTTATAEATKTAEPAKAPAVAAQPPAGTTSYFGAATGPVIDTTAKMNPDYKPASPAPDQAPVPAKAADAPAPTPSPAKTTIVVQPPPARGTTSFFGITPPVAEAPAKPNPDYKPAATAAVAPAPAIEAPAKPAEPATPSLASQALSVVKSLIAPAPPRPPGVTSYFGTTPPVPEATARANPDYVPTKPASGDAAPDATPKASPPKASTTAAAPAKPAVTAAQTAATGPASAVGLCRASVDKAMGGGRIAFQSAKADLRKSSIAVLDRVASAFKGCPSLRLTVEGHTDNTGQADMNQKLSLARAQTVADYLVSKGIDAARLSPAGVGSARPVAPNTSAINKARNRRIEFAVSDL